MTGSGPLWAVAAGTLVLALSCGGYDRTDAPALATRQTVTQPGAADAEDAGTKSVLIRNCIADGFGAPDEECTASSPCSADADCGSLFSCCVDGACGECPTP